MRSKITVIDAELLAEQLTDGDWVEIATDTGGLPGSEAVVLGPGCDVMALGGHVASRAPSAAIVLLDPTGIRDAVTASMFPRGRVVAVDEGEAVDVVKAIVFDRCTTMTVTLLGLDDEVVTTSATVGAGGVRQIVLGDSPPTRSQ